MTADLLGDVARVLLKHPNAYAAQPGTGPQGRTCRDCAFYCRNRWHRRTYRKCGLVRSTHGAGTDICARAPACRRYEPREGAPW